MTGVYSATYSAVYGGSVEVTAPPPVLPQFVVEAGMVPAAPVAATGSLVLDDPAFGLLDTGTLGTGTVWTDISAYVLNFSVNRPSSRQQGPILQFEAGTASITLDNSDGRFDPDNSSGPYVLLGVSQIRAMIPVRIRAVFGGVLYPLFGGFADGWQETAVDYEAGYSEVTLGATDGFKVLSGITLAAAGLSGSGAATGSRINSLLNLAGWYTSTEQRQVATGDSTLQGTTLGDTALNLMQIASDSEIGQLYCSASGAVTFRNRRSLITDTRSASPAAFFGDNPSGAELPVAAFGRADDDTTIANDVQATRLGGSLQEVTDTTSEALFLFPRTYARSDLILQTDVDALSWAQWVLYVSKSGENRFDSVSVDPQAQPYDLWPQVLGREMGDRIEVTKRPVGTPSVTKDGFISGVAHSFDAAASVWLTTWTLQDASKYGSFFTLDNATTGTLDSNALAW